MRLQGLLGPRPGEGEEERERKREGEGEGGRERGFRCAQGPLELNPQIPPLPAPSVPSHVNGPRTRGQAAVSQTETWHSLACGTGHKDSVWPSFCFTPGLPFSATGRGPLKTV